MALQLNYVVVLDNFFFLLSEKKKKIKKKKKKNTLAWINFKQQVSWYIQLGP